MHLASSYREAAWVSGPHASTLTALSIARMDVDGFIEDHGMLPGGVGQLDDEKRLHDGWGRPLRLEGTLESWSITSRGRDGREGGRGADRDISITWQGERTAPSLLDLVHSTIGRLLAVYAACLAVIVAVVADFLVNGRVRSASWLSRAVALLASLIAYAWCVDGLFWAATW